MKSDSNQSMVFDLQLLLGESYFHGTATTKNSAYPINIQMGKTSVVLPNGFEGMEGALIYFKTESGKSLSIKSKIEIGKDWIEIYDDMLVQQIADDIPVNMTIYEVVGQ